MATIFFLNPKAFEMGILTVDNINRGKEKYAGKQFGLFFDKTETGKGRKSAYASFHFRVHP